MTWNPLPDGAGAFDAANAPAPLYRDPVYDGAADPSVMWHLGEEAWWILYTQRRANAAVPGKGWIHGSDVAVASSPDGTDFLYRGTLDLDVEPGRNTFWAPEILHHDGTYHAYVSYVTGVPQTWDRPRDVLHFTTDALGLEGWTCEGALALSSDRVIDADVHRLPDGTWRMWYKDERAGSVTFAADSEDLYAWDADADPTLDDRTHEAPVVFERRGYYWLLADSWDGLSVWHSPDGDDWTAQEGRLLDDPDAKPDGERARQTALQVAPLRVADGRLVARRDRDA